VNDYLRAIVAVPYTAKDFRTWGGTLRAATVLSDIGPPATPTEAKRNVATAVRLVAAELGNTPTIARKSYIHPWSSRATSTTARRSSPPGAWGRRTPRRTPPRSAP
jgi:DNA topoisomerase IB